MTSATNSVSTKRKPCVAAAFSLALAGLGHIYCGKLAKGLLLAVLSGVFIPTILITLAYSSPINTVWLLVAAAPFLILNLYAIIDSYLLAHRTQADYMLREYNRGFVYLLLVVMGTGGCVTMSLYVRDRFLQAFIVPSPSMAPTIIHGDRLLANKIAYAQADPQRGDIIVFPNPDNRRQMFIKRVVALPGDTVEVRDSRLLINGKELPLRAIPRVVGAAGESFVETNGSANYRIMITPSQTVTADMPATVIPKNTCFVLGDNRNNSLDSRHFGPVPLACVRGRFDYLYWPAANWSRFGTIK
ncbi:MAG: signal peptidase I [Phycisphaerae bacterium]|jgi:signal peptidase I